MSKARASKDRRGKAKQPRVGLALAGGGPIGGIYEIGALLALADALEGVDFHDLYVYVGVSSGSLVAAGLANGLSAEELYQIYIENSSLEHPISPYIFQTPALDEYGERVVAVPELVLNALWRYVQNPLEPGLWGSLQALGRALPTGLFDGAPIERFLTRLFTSGGRTNDFRTLRHPLYVVATDLDSGESVVFGSRGCDSVPIALAVRASTTLPGLFPPVKINGHYFVDGALNKTLHASVALKEGAELVVCINPLVPFDARVAEKRNGKPPEKLISGGLPVVLSQTFRALIHSRMRVGMAQYDVAHPGADVVLFEPSADDAKMFFANVLSYANRLRVCDHAYQHTIRELARRKAQLTPVFARHGVRLRPEVVGQAHPSIEARLWERPRHARKLLEQLNFSLRHLGRWLETHAPRHP